METSTKLAAEAQNIGGDRRKHWDNKSSEEKLETLRQEIRNNRYLLRRIGELEIKIQKLEAHSHADGRVVIPIEYSRYGNGTVSSYDALD